MNPLSLVVLSYVRFLGHEEDQFEVLAEMLRRTDDLENSGPVIARNFGKCLANSKLPERYFLL
jgi:hypothetical protein